MTRVQLEFRGRPVVRDRALVMAIINRTPDSFYDKGATFTDEKALAAVAQAVADGADIVDIGHVEMSCGRGSRRWRQKFAGQRGLGLCRYQCRHGGIRG